jgi:hypothetical protein
MLPRNQQQEALSRAYVRAIAAQTGVVVSEPENDYGIDMSLREVTVRDGRWRDVGPQLDLQIKSSTRANVGEALLSYDLPVVNYDDLRVAVVGAPRLLVVFVMPDDQTRWVSQTAEELTLRHRAYWLTLAGFPSTTSRTTTRVALPLTNIFSAVTIRGMMQQLREGRGL